MTDPLEAQPEPVATLHDDGYFTWKRDEFRRKYDRERVGWRMDVYAAPPQRPVRLTDERIEELRQEAGVEWTAEVSRCDLDELGRLIRAVEAEVLRLNGIGGGE